ncbi:capsular polysaccharide transport system permease protein [Paraburkholderia sp. CI2]|uniref:chain-length determining protein n=1 Tax=Paraburkholderia sp. CI2 TaxID=2723093 RepID=UPI0017BCD0EA|nr:chain-length determining protein [Paraburkholderia sp. CI2]MBB5470063.1 capsular polysaccharide transport system permease protein [Paraburkholderia sp. CI2]
MKETVAIENWRSSGRWTAAYDKVKSTFFSFRLFKLIIRLMIIFAIVSVPYWVLVASDRYVSQATVIIQRTDQVNGPSVAISALSAAGGTANSADQLLLREYLLSQDMLDQLDAALDLRSHYSNWHRDPISRMWFKNGPEEWFFQYWLNRVDVEYDDYSGVLRIQAQAYDAKTAKAIVALMVKLGEQHMNELGHQLAQSQVDFLQKQVTFAHDRFLDASRDVLNFQNEKGLAAPASTAGNMDTIIDRLEGQKTDLQTQIASLPANLSPNQPTVVMLKKNLAALEQQIALKRAELASPKSRTLNYTVEEFQRLQMQVNFTQDLYKTALSSLEQGRMDAARKLKMVSILQSPTTPSYPMEPQRFYNVLITLLITLALIGVIKLLESIILDHVD